jgi:hypothetical protein
MPDDKKDLYLYEALELRAEFNARIKSLKSLMPEQQSKSGVWSMRSDNRERLEPVDDFDSVICRKDIKKLEYKARKLNTAIQTTNFTNSVTVSGESMSIAESLDLRKAVNHELAELQDMLKISAYRRIIYKEERNIEENPALSFADISVEFEKKRLLFRELNRALRRVSFLTTVNFKDEN